jgi:hypothetical protein
LSRSGAHGLVLTGLAPTTLWYNTVTTLKPRNR